VFIIKASDRVKELYLNGGYNCAESIWLALNENDLDQEKLNFGMRLASVFGGGLGCGSTCGIVGGAALSLGRWLGRDIGEERNPQLPQYAEAFVKWFNNNYSSLDCCDIKEIDNHKIVCAQILADSVDYIETILDEGLEEEKCSL
jgi:C_GCAxxG_C_C family probable redox protein